MLTRATAAAAVLTLASTVLGQPPATTPPVKPATPAPAAQPKPDAKPLLLVGDKAPPLAIEKWVKGDPITGFEKGKVYVLEFWAPNSPGAANNMPHLTELQKQYKDKGVMVVGIASKDQRTALDAVEKTLAEKGEAIGYTIAWDGSRKTYEAFVEASGSRYLPVAFIVDGNGVIAHQHAGDDKQLDKPLAEIVAGSYDLKAAVEKSRKAADERAARAREEAVRAALSKIEAAYRAKEWAAILAAYDTLPEQVRPRAAALRFEAMLLGTKDSDKAYAFGREIVDGWIAKDSQGLNQVAWAIVDPANKVEKKDLDLAMKAANKADELRGGKDAAIIDTVARVHFCKGDVAKALELQQKAVAAIKPGDAQQIKDELNRTLKEYEEAAKKK